MPYRGGRWIQAAVVLLVLLSSGCLERAVSLQTESVRPETFVGKLSRVYAVGGETTGWMLQLDSERDVEGARVKKIEVDPAPRGLKLDALEGKRVEAQGNVAWREGVE